MERFSSFFLLFLWRCCRLVDVDVMYRYYEKTGCFTSERHGSNTPRFLLLLLLLLSAGLCGLFHQTDDVGLLAFKRRQDQRGLIGFRDRWGNFFLNVAVFPVFIWLYLFVIILTFSWCFGGFLFNMFEMFEMQPVQTKAIGLGDWVSI